MKIINCTWYEIYLEKPCDPKFPVSITKGSLCGMIYLAEDAPTNWVAETESQLQGMGGTELQMEQLRAEAKERDVEEDNQR